MRAQNNMEHGALLAEKAGLGGSLLEQSMIETGRLMRRWSRQPEVLTTTFVLPILLLLMFYLVLGGALSFGATSDPLYGLVPMTAVMGAVYGATGTGASLFHERESGLLRRFWVLPIHRAVGLTGRLIAECARAFCVAVVVLAVGMALGLRFQQGWLGALLAATVPVLLVLGFTPVMVLVGVSRMGDKVIEFAAIVVLIGTFFNTGFVAVDNYPAWLQPMVRAQPMSCAIEAIRGLTLGGPVAAPLLQTAAWSAALLAGFSALAVRGYRAAAQS